MAIVSGQGILIKGRFANGAVCNYERPFLIIDTASTIITALNVSSLKGKEAKLFMDSNENLDPYSPPFREPSFVKLDEIYEIENFPEIETSVVSDGKTLNPELLEQIRKSQASFRSNYPRRTQIVRLTPEELIKLNPKLSRTRTTT